MTIEIYEEEIAQILQAHFGFSGMSIDADTLRLVYNDINGEILDHPFVEVQASVAVND